MFDYMVRILNNGRVLIRDTETGEADIIRPSQIAEYFEKALETEYAAEIELNEQIARIKEQAGESNEGQ